MKKLKLFVMSLCAMFVAVLGVNAEVKVSVDGGEATVKDTFQEALTACQSNQECKITISGTATVSDRLSVTNNPSKLIIEGAADTNATLNLASYGMGIYWDTEIKNLEINSTASIAFIVGNGTKIIDVKFEDCKIEHTPSSLHQTLHLAQTIRMQSDEDAHSNVTLKNTTINATESGIAVNSNEFFQVISMAADYDGKGGGTLNLENSDINSTGKTTGITVAAPGTEVSVTGGNITSRYGLDVFYNNSKIAFDGTKINSWGIVTFAATSSSTANNNVVTFKNSTIKSVNTFGGDYNNYAAFNFPAGTNNTISLDEGSSLSVNGNVEGDTNQYVAIFNENATGSKVELKGTVSVEGNSEPFWFAYATTDQEIEEPDYTSDNEVVIGENAILNINNNEFGVINGTTGEVTNYETLAEALAVAKDGDTIILGKNVDVETIISKLVTIQTGGHDANNIKAGEGYTKVVNENLITIKKATPSEADQDPKLADYSKLDEVLANAKKVDTSKYTKESVEVLLKAIKEAEALSRELTEDDQATVDNMVKVLNDAIAGLKVPNTSDNIMSVVTAGMLSLAVIAGGIVLVRKNRFNN